VRELIGAGDIEEIGAASAVRGRRPTLLAVKTRGRLVVAVDVRPGRTHLALADFAGQVLAREDIDTPAEPGALAEQLSERLAVMLRNIESREKVHGIGIVVPGMVDRRSGTVLYAPRLGWRDVQLRDPISHALGLPVFIESAPIACALARLWSLNGTTRVVNNFAYVSVSDGIGVGIVHKGEVLRGETHTAGELGHVSLDPNGPACACGRRGCWEAFACNATTVARYQALSGAPPIGSRSTARSKAGPMAIEEIVRRAKVGEPAAVEALVETGRQVGRGLANVASAFNPKRIYVGGEVTAAWELLEAPIREALVEGTLTEATASTPVYADPNPAEYRLLGAVALVAAPSFAAARVG
jgi:predicted NBD/HSP70 family sugar kinase